jgi:hypothetical protein
MAKECNKLRIPHYYLSFLVTAINSGLESLSRKRVMV